MGPEVCFANKGRLCSLQQKLMSTKEYLLLASALWFILCSAWLIRKLSLKENIFVLFYVFSYQRSIIEDNGIYFTSQLVYQTCPRIGGRSLHKRDLKQLLLFRSWSSLWEGAKESTFHERLCLCTCCDLCLESPLLPTLTPAFYPRLLGELVILQEVF